MTDDNTGWPWRPDLCPADLHYTEYLTTGRGLGAATPGRIIHMGPGLHHHVGLLMGSLGWDVTALTVVKDDVEAFEKLDRKPPNYLCLLRDVRDGLGFNGSTVVADSMSLFHLGEIEARAGQRTDAEVIDAALDWTRELVFYTGSYAWPKLSPLLYARRDRLEYSGYFKSLAIYQPTEETPA